MSSDAILSIVALVVPSLAVAFLVLPPAGRRRSPARSWAGLGPSGTELVPAAPSLRPVELDSVPPTHSMRAPGVKTPTRGAGSAVSSSTVAVMRTRRSLDLGGAAGNTGALITAASSITARPRSRVIVSSTARRYAYMVDSTGRARPRRRLLVVAGLGAVVAAVVVAAR